MPMQILEIVLYSRDGKVRRLKFRTGAVNIITGRSGTGKSAIIPIVDYCLGRSAFNIPEGVIRDNVSWYGIRLSMDSNSEVFIAKPAPAENAASQSKAMFLMGAQIEPPAFGDLSINSNDEAVEVALTDAVGISPNLNVPDIGHSRAALKTNFSHTKFYLFQEQTIIANKDILFYRQTEQFIPQAIKDTLPYLLGAVGDDRLANVMELRRLKRELKLLVREMEESNAITAPSNIAFSLVEEAKQAGVSLQSFQDENADYRGALDAIAQWSPARIPEPSDGQSQDLRAKLVRVRAELREVSESEAAATAFTDYAASYNNELKEQTARLETIGLFRDSPEDGTCPFCNSTEALLPKGEKMRARLNALTEQLRNVSAERPKLHDHLQSLRTSQAQLREEVRRLEVQILALDREEARAQEIESRNSRIARVQGKVLLYLENVPKGVQADSNDRTRRELESRIEALESRIESEGGLDQLASHLNRLGIHMTQLARRLTFEHSEFPLRLDLGSLTVVADRPHRPFPMSRMGSGQNWLGCHLSCLLALHTHFRQEQRPVPAFLILDQPSQVYFPTTEAYDEADGTAESTSLARADMEAVTNMFDLLFEVVEAAKGQLQVIVFEHANLGSPQYHDALVEQPWTGGDHALVPQSWLN